MSYARRRPPAALGLLIVPGLALTIAGAASCGRGGGEGADEAAAPEAAVRAPAAVEATAREVPVTLSLDGTLIADEESRVTSVVPGRVVEVLVERGAKVEKGAPMVRLRDVDYRLAARAARSALEQVRARLGMAEEAAAPPRPEETAEARAARADLDLAESQLRRAEELGGSGALSAQQLDEIRARTAAARERHQSALNQARAAVAALAGAQTQLDQATTAAGESVVRAPFAGEIAERMVSVGEFVAPQVPLVTLVRADPLRIELQVPQQRLLAVRPGQRVEITVDAVPGRLFDGTVRYVSAAVRRDTRGLTVEAVVPNSEGVLRPGLFVSARISTGEQRTVSVVPRTAVLTAAGVSRAFVLAGGHIEERVVTVAERRGDEVWVSEGLRPGERVATEGLERLADGQRIQGS